MIISQEMTRRAGRRKPPGCHAAAAGEPSGLRRTLAYPNAGRRPFKEFQFVNAKGVSKDTPSIVNPNERHRPPTKRPFKQLEFVKGNSVSAFITTRCYSPSGVELWNADHGSRVFALAVDGDLNLYQAGDLFTGGLGDSLFHTASSENYPLITKMGPTGSPRWAILRSSPGGGGTAASYGICATAAGALYASFSDTAGSAAAYVAKLNRSTGAALLTLPTAGFVFTNSPGGYGTTPTGIFGPIQQFQQVRSDAAGNVYAIGNRADTGGTGDIGWYVHKWSSDGEAWIFRHSSITNYNNYGVSMVDVGGIDVDGAGNVAMTRLRDVPASGGRILVVAGPDQANTPNTGDGTLLAINQAAFVGHHCAGVGCSPGGRVIFKETSPGTRPGGVTEIVATIDPFTPTFVDHVSPSSLFVPGGPQAIAVNDDGVYAYSRDRTTAPGNISHEIRATDDSLLGQYDHGGQIYAAIVLPDGTTIVAGDRVAR